MKKFMIGVLSLVMCFTLVGCSSKKEEENVNPPEEVEVSSVYDDTTDETEEADEYEETADYDEDYVEEYADYTGEEQYYD